MADYTNRGEYRSPRARRVYKAPKKKKTEGEKLEESGQYLKDPETEVDTSQPLQSSTIKDVSETLTDAKLTHTGWTLGGSVLGEYNPILPKGAGAVIGGAVGYGVSRIKKWGASQASDIFNKILLDRVPRNYFDTAKTALTGGLDVGTARDVSGNIARSADDLSADFTPGIVRGNTPPTGTRGLLTNTSFNGVQYTKTTVDSTLEIPWNKVTNPKEKGRKMAGAFTDQASDPKGWAKLVEIVKADMERILPGADIPIPGFRNKRPGKLVAHHTAPVKQIAWSVNGLNNEARQNAADYIAKGIGQRLGYSPEQLAQIPAQFHKYIHRMLNDSMGLYDISLVEKKLGLNPGEFAKLEVWDRKEGFDMIIDNIVKSKEDIYTMMNNISIQLSDNIVDPDVLVDSMEKMLELESRIRLKPGDLTLNEIVDAIGARSREALDFVEDQLPAAERPVKNILYTLALKDKEEAIKFAKARRGTTPGNIGRKDYNLPDSKGLE